MKPTQVRECSRKLTETKLREISRKLTKQSRTLHHLLIPEGFASPVYARMFVARMIALHQTIKRFEQAIYASPRPPRRQKAKA